LLRHLSQIATREAWPWLSRSLIPAELLQFLVGDIHQPLAVVGLLSLPHVFFRFSPQISVYEKRS